MPPDELPGSVNPTPAETPAAKSWGQITAEAIAMSEGAPPHPLEQAALPGQPAVAPQIKEWAPPKPVRPHSLAERLAAKAARNAERERVAPLEQQLASERAALAQLTQSQAHAQAEFKRLVDEGKIDDALKVTGLPVSFRELNQAYLRGKGAIAPADPRYDELSKQNKALQDRIDARERAEAQARAEAQSRSEYESDLADTAAELQTLPYKGAAALAQAPGFAEECLGLINQHAGRLTLEQAAGIVRENYLALHQSLMQAFGAQPAQQAVTPPARAGVLLVKSPRVGVAPITHLPPAGSAPHAPPANETEEQRWKRISSEALTLQG